MMELFHTQFPKNQIADHKNINLTSKRDKATLMKVISQSPNKLPFSLIIKQKSIELQDTLADLYSERLDTDKTMRPLKNIDFCSSTRKIKFLTIGIH
jgi:hypothetical protein